MPRTLLYQDRAYRLAQRAMAAGARRTGVRSFHWDISGNCQSPVRWVYEGRPSGRHIEVRPGTDAPIWIEIDRRCRKCDNCRTMRSNLWKMRAQSELRRASRTWFSTLTLAPEYQVQLTARCRLEAGQQGIDFDAQSDAERFAQRVSLLGREVTKYLKRVRKNSGASFRYLVVFEQHDSEETSPEYRGLPHVHLLIHELDLAEPVRKKHLKQAWHLGFTSHELAKDGRAAFYVSKYISKAMLVRVRASIGYGEGTEPSHTILDRSERSERERKGVPVLERKGIDPIKEENLSFWTELYGDKANDPISSRIPQGEPGLSNERAEHDFTAFAPSSRKSKLSPVQDCQPSDIDEGEAALGGERASGSKGRVLFGRTNRGTPLAEL